MKTLKFKLFFLLAIACSSAVFAQTSQPGADKILGIYWSPKKDAKIEIYKTGSRYFGKSIWVASPRQDTENPDAALRSRQVLGIDLLSNFIYEDGGYTHGKVYDPESGKIYDCKMKLTGDYLKIRGYIVVSLFGRTEVFKRVN